MAERVEIVYDLGRWRLFNAMRREAAAMMAPLRAAHIDCLAYGSLARGDVSDDSDIDVFIPGQQSPTIVEAALERHGVRPTGREIVQATPGYAAKAYIYTAELRGYSLPLVELRPTEGEFYSFAGSIRPEQVEAGLRVPGVDKRLMLIEPTPSGHVESPVAGREGEVAKLLGVGISIVLERVRTLERRRRVGRTGVYLKRVLSPEEGFSEVLRELSLRRPAMRRRTR
jgi:predicted nucleotidyltransferase